MAQIRSGLLVKREHCVEVFLKFASTEVYSISKSCSLFFIFLRCPLLDALSALLARTLAIDVHFPARYLFSFSPFSHLLSATHQDPVHPEISVSSLSACVSVRAHSEWYKRPTVFYFRSSVSSPSLVVEIIYPHIPPHQLLSNWLPCHFVRSFAGVTC